MQNFIQAYSWINIRFLLEGLWVTVEVSVVSIIASFIIGSVLGCFGTSGLNIYRQWLGLLLTLFETCH
ncbi:hypothetical protein TUA1478L_02880 [Lactiplantibacillus plantarum]